MRSAFLALVLTLPLLAGCIESNSSDDLADLAWPAGALLPSGATLTAGPGVLALTWKDLALSAAAFEATIPIPQGATMVHATLAWPGMETGMLDLRDADTGRRRCNTPYLEAWNIVNREAMQCTGLTAMDGAGSEWIVRARASPAAEATLIVSYSNAPLDGAAAQLNLDQLSQATHDLLPTEALFMDSFDGTPIRVEVTLPEGEGPWPTVLAASPYNGQAGRLSNGGEPAMWEYWVQDWAKRGYAAVMADVRGFGQSGGCVNIWGPEEQADQVALVEWAAAQEWSNGNIGFYGQSYVGTTPVEAAINAPEALKAIIAVAPVINAYDDWHFGGVPNGENTGSPQSYQIFTDHPLDALDLADPYESAMNVAKGVCDPTLVARANDGTGRYSDFYDERNFTKGAGDVTAAVLYTQGFADSNVKSAMIPGWFNGITAPKLGLFGHWVHQHAVRADQEVLFLAWMDQYVKGKDMGLEALPAVQIATNVDTVRGADSWPTAGLDEMSLYTHYAGGELAAEPSDANGVLVLDPVGTPLDSAVGSDVMTFKMVANESFAMAGVPKLRLAGTLEGAANAHVAAYLYDADTTGKQTLVTFGMFNLAHRNGHDEYDPLLPVEAFAVDLPFLPTEYVVEEGHELSLVVRAARDGDWYSVQPGGPGTLTLYGGEDGSRFHFDAVPMDAYEAMPATAQP